MTGVILRASVLGEIVDRDKKDLEMCRSTPHSVPLLTAASRNYASRPDRRSRSRLKPCCFRHRPTPPLVRSGSSRNAASPGAGGGCGEHQLISGRAGRSRPCEERYAQEWIVSLQVDGRRHRVGSRWGQIGATSPIGPGCLRPKVPEMFTPR
jgi:hypothetical protein